MAIDFPVLFVEYECSRAELGSGAACSQCRKSKKRCDWTSEAQPGPSEAGPSTSSAAPSSHAVQKSVVVEIPTQHRSRPSVEVMQEIATEIRGLREAYDERLDQEDARMKQDEFRLKQEEARFRQVEERTRQLEHQQLLMMSAIQRLTAALVGDFQAALARRTARGESVDVEDLEPGEGEVDGDGGDMEVED